MQPVEMWCFPQGHFRLLTGAEGRNVHGCNVPPRCVTEASRTYPTSTTSPLTPKSRLKFWSPVNSKFVEKSSCCLFSYLMVGPVCTERDLKMFFSKECSPFPPCKSNFPLELFEHANSEVSQMLLLLVRLLQEDLKKVYLT